MPTRCSVTDLSLSAILTVCAQNGVTFYLEGDAVKINGDHQKIGAELFKVVKLKFKNGSLAAFLRENPAFKPGPALTSVSRGERMQAPPAGNTLPREPGPAAPASPAQRNSPAQKNPAPATGLFPGATEKPADGPARGTAAPASRRKCYCNGENPNFTYHSPNGCGENAGFANMAAGGNIGNPVAGAAPTVPDHPPAAVRVETRPQVRVGVRSEGPGRDMTKDPWMPTRRCWPCNMVYCIVDPACDPAPNNCLHCGNRLVGLDAERPRETKNTLCWMGRLEFERRKIAPGSKEMAAFNERVKEDPTLAATCVLEAHHQGDHQWTRDERVQFQMPGAGA